MHRLQISRNNGNLPLISGHLGCSSLAVFSTPVFEDLLCIRAFTSLNGVRLS